MTSIRTPLLVACILGLALACAKPLAEQAPLSVQPLVFEPGSARKPDYVVVITDGSGTMYAGKTFPQAKALTQSFVRGMPDRSQPSLRPEYVAGLIGFGGDERIVSGPARFDRAALQSSADSLRILGSIDGMGGSTPFDDVFSEVAATMPEREGGSGDHYLAVVVFSDGRTDCVDPSLMAAQRLVATFDGTVCFHTVQTGSDPEGAEFLNSLSAMTSCGTHRPADSVMSPGPFMAFERDVFAGAKPIAAAGDCARIVLQGVTFAFDKWNITPESAVVLDVAAETLARCSDVPVRIEGHTDWIGTETYNQGLSERRARSVYDYLKRKGVRNRMTTIGYGETRPIAPNANPDGSDNPEGRARNRRVELHGSR